MYESHNTGWTWNEAVKYIQNYWNDAEFNIDYKNEIEEVICE